MSGTRGESGLQDIRSLAAGTGIILGGRLAGRALLLLDQVLLARWLGPTSFGLFSLGWALLQIGSLVLPLGLHQSVIHYGAQRWPEQIAEVAAVLRRALQLALGLALMGAVLLWGAAGWTAQTFFHKPAMEPVLQITAWSVGLAALLRVLAAGTRITGRMSFSTLAEDLAPALGLLLAFLGLRFVGIPPLRAALLAMLLAMAGGVVLALGFWAHLFGPLLHHRHGQPPPLAAFLAYASAASLAGIFTMLTLRVDRLLIGRFLPATQVGLYQAAAQPAMLSATVLSAFNTAFAPIISRHYHRGEHARLNRLFAVSTRWGLYLAMPLFLMVWMAPRALLGLVFGPAYAQAAWPMRIMALGQMVNTGTGSVGLLLLMSGHPSLWLLMAASAFLLNLFLGWWWIPNWGNVGAALASSLSLTWLFGGGLILVRLRLHLWPYDQRYRNLLLATALALLSGGICKGLLAHRLHTWPGLMLLALTVMGSFYLGLLLRPDPEDRAWFLALLQHRRKGNEQGEGN